MWLQRTLFHLSWGKHSRIECVAHTKTILAPFPQTKKKNDTRYSQMPAKDSLIDLMDDEPAAPSGNGSTKPTDDLADIFGPTVAAPSVAPSAPNSQARAADIMNLFSQPTPQPTQPSLFHPHPHSQPPPPPQQQQFTGGYPGQMGQIRLPSTPQPQNPGAGVQPGGSPATPPQQTQTQAQKDPFADLASLF